MGKISDLIADDHFQHRLREGRGKADIMMVYRGKTEGHSVDDGEGGKAIAKIESCIDNVTQLVDLKLTSAAIYSGNQCVYMTLRFALSDTEDELAIYHDTRTGLTEFQIIHPDKIEINVSSQSDLLAMRSAPYETLKLHFAEHEIGNVENILKRLCLVPITPTELREQKYILELQEA